MMLCYYTKPIPIKIIVHNTQTDISLCAVNGLLTSSVSKRTHPLFSLQVEKTGERKTCSRITILVSPVNGAVGLSFSSFRAFWPCLPSLYSTTTLLFSFASPWDSAFVPSCQSVVKAMKADSQRYTKPEATPLLCRHYALTAGHGQVVLFLLCYTQSPSLNNTNKCSNNYGYERKKGEKVIVYACRHI